MMHTHAHTHAHEHAHVHVHAHAHTHTHTHTYTHICTHTHTYTHARTHSLTRSPIYSQNSLPSSNLACRQRPTAKQSPESQQIYTLAKYSYMSTKEP